MESGSNSTSSRDREFPTAYNGTVHDWFAQNGYRTDTFNLPNYSWLSSDNDFSQWHTYGVLWESGKVTWYWDNNPLFLSSAGDHGYAGRGAHSEFNEGPNWSFGDTNGVTSTDLKLNVDWVRVWQNNPVTVTLPNGATASRGTPSGDTPLLPFQRISPGRVIFRSQPFMEPVFRQRRGFCV